MTAAIDIARRVIAWRLEKGSLEYPRRADSDPQDSHAMVFQVASIAVHGCALAPAEAWQVVRGFCAHSDRPWSDREIEHKLRQAQTAASNQPRGYLLRMRERNAAPAEASGVAPEPRAPRVPGRPEIRPEAVAQMIRGVPPVTTEWLAARSPVDPARVSGAGHFLNHLYAPGERVLIFTSEYSQGDYLWTAGNEPTDGSPSLRGGWRLSPDRGVRAVRSELPDGGAKGVWFLVQPVTGTWAVKASAKWERPEGEKPHREIAASYTRRSEINVTAWRYYVLESDTLPASDWLRVVVALPLPIAALYTSGGRSIHALVRMPASGKVEWDAVRDQLREVVCPLGADAGALSGVRLSRLPFCKRGGNLQRLLYLNPRPESRPILLNVEGQNE